MLTKIAALVMDQMELRLAAKKIAELEQAERTISEQVREANQRLSQSEQQFRDLFEEAPIAYVHQGIDTLIFRANRTATLPLGCFRDGRIASGAGTDGTGSRRGLNLRRRAGLSVVKWASGALATSS
jgi:PAS domain-containing protein